MLPEPKILLQGYPLGKIPRGVAEANAHETQPPKPRILMTLPTAPGVGRRSVGEAGVLIVPDAHGRQEQDGDRHSCAGRRPVCRPSGARPHPVAPRPPESDRPRPLRGRRRMTRRSPEGPGVRPTGHAPQVSGLLLVIRRRPRRGLGAVCQNAGRTPPRHSWSGEWAQPSPTFNETFFDKSKL
jgi:hypothetical protein